MIHKFGLRKRRKVLLCLIFVPHHIHVHVQGQGGSDNESLLAASSKLFESCEPHMLNLYHDELDNSQSAYLQT